MDKAVERSGDDVEEAGPDIKLKGGESEIDIDIELDVAIEIEDPAISKLLLEYKQLRQKNKSLEQRDEQYEVE